jgi:hypothetical protein
MKYEQNPFFLPVYFSKGVEYCTVMYDLLQPTVTKTIQAGSKFTTRALVRSHTQDTRQLLETECANVSGRHVYTVRSESRCALIKVVGSDVHEPLYSSTTVTLCGGKQFSFSRTALCAVASPIAFSCANSCNDFDWLRSIASEMSINSLSFSLDGLPLRSAFNIEPVSRNFSIRLRTALRWGTGCFWWFFSKLLLH